MLGDHCSMSWDITLKKQAESPVLAEREKEGMYTVCWTVITAKNINHGKEV